MDVPDEAPGLNLISPPWTEEQVKNLNEYQNDDRWHPFTCGGERRDELHQVYALIHKKHDYGILEATPEGWICPVCDYKQIWAHAFMAKGK